VADAPARKFYLIATRMFGRTAELTAVPVTGECELVSTDVVAPTTGLPAYVVGLLLLKDEIVELIDLAKIAGGEDEA
jgi:chemotaxis signal transduction protein